jgi:hypothetical protein
MEFNCLFEFVENKDTKSIVKWFEDTVFTKASKQKLLIAIVDYFAQFHMSSNLWVLRRMKFFIHEIEIGGSDTTALIELCLLISQLPRKDISAKMRYRYNIDVLLESWSNDGCKIRVDIDHKIRDITKDPVIYNWMLFFDHCMTRNDAIALEIFRCIQEHKKRHAMFACMFIIIESLDYISKEVKEFIELSKFLFLYNKGNKSQQDCRRQILFYAIFLAMKNKISFISYAPIQVSRVETRFEYLFTITQRDDYARELVKQDIIQRRKQVNEDKIYNVNL